MLNISLNVLSFGYLHYFFFLHYALSTVIFGIMVINIFLQSSVMMMAISAIGVLIFAGLTAYYTQDIKRTYVEHAHHGDQEWLDKAASDGAFMGGISED